MVLSCRRCHRKNRVHAADLARAHRCGACKSDLAPIDEPLDADDVLFDEVTRQSPLPVLVDFWAAWCGPCRVAAPEVRRVAAEMAGRAVVLKVDTEAHPALAARFGVQSIPNFLVLHGGRIVRQQAGVVPADRMREWLEISDRL